MEEYRIEDLAKMGGMRQGRVVGDGNRPNSKELKILSIRGA